MVSLYALLSLCSVASLGWVTPSAVTERVTPLFFSLKNWRPFLVITVSASSAVSPLFFSPEKLTTFFAHHRHFLLLHSGVTPLEGVTPQLFYLYDLVSPLFFVNLPTKMFSFGCHPLEGVTRGGPPPSDATAFDGTHCAAHGEMAMLNGPWMAVYVPGWFIRPRMVTHPSTNRGRRRTTTSIHTNALP